MTRTTLAMLTLAGCGWKLGPPSAVDSSTGADVAIPAPDAPGDAADAALVDPPDAGDPADALASDAPAPADGAIDVSDPPAPDVVIAADVPTSAPCPDGGAFARNVSCDTALPLEPGVAHTDTLCGAPVPAATGCACPGCVQTFYSVVNYAGSARPVRITTSAGVVATTDATAWPGCFATPPPVWTCTSADVTVVVPGIGSAATYRFALVAPPGPATVAATFE